MAASTVSLTFWPAAAMVSPMRSVMGLFCSIVSVGVLDGVVGRELGREAETEVQMCRIDAEGGRVDLLNPRLLSELPSMTASSWRAPKSTIGQLQ